MSFNITQQITSQFKIAVFITAIFLGNNLVGRELYQETIDLFTGRNGIKIDLIKAELNAKTLISRNEIVGYCVMGSLYQLNGELRKAQDYYFHAYSSGDLLKYAKLEPDAGNFFLAEYYMVADPIDIEKANEHYKISANNGFGASMASYGVNRLIGNGIPANKHEALSYLIEGMRKDSPQAYYNFAIYLLSIANERRVTARAYLEYSSIRGFRLADSALKDWF
jgi:TPR repeat protein